jgi:hypothetical protein
MSEVFRVERNRNFTVMCNHHLKNKELSLKAKGLLSIMLSLPDSWHYNIKGLASLSRDGIDAVRATLKELEAHGYVTRNRLRKPEGFLSDMEYIIREIPEGESN